MNDNQGEIIRDLGRLEGRLTQLAETVDRNRATAADGLFQLNQKIDDRFKKNEEDMIKILDKLESIALKEAQVKGAWTLATWFAGVMVTVGALLATFIKYFWGPT